MTLPWLLLFVLIAAVPPAYLVPSPSKPGGNQKCPVGQYRFMRNRQPTCSPCTTSCTEKKNLIEISPCTETSDRYCQCASGFFCTSPVNKTCRRDCEPCTNGFTKEPNLKSSCQEFTVCSSGEVVITEGSPIKDRVCGKPNIPPKPKLSSSNPKFLTSHSVNVTDKSIQTSLTVSTLPLKKTRHSELIFAPSTGGPVSPLESKISTILISFLLLLMALALLLYLSLRYKCRAVMCKWKQAGLVFGRYQPVFPGVGPNTNAPAPMNDITGVTEHGQGQGSFPGKNQKVTMEHVGNSDGINNTVGSIFIYSPGMVILGSNSNEKKGEAFPGSEEEEEDVRLMSVPQQESSSEDVVLATQEELDKELSIPIPATSK